MNMKITILYALIGALLMHAPSNAVAQPKPAVAEWTFMVFMNGDNDLESFALQDFEEMAEVGSTDKINVVVQFDRSPFYSKSYGDWTQTLRFRVTKGMEPNVANAYQDLGELNMGSDIVLKDFVRSAQMNYPAKRYILVIWDHGQGWRGKQTTQLVSTTSTFRTNSQSVVQSRKEQTSSLRGRAEIGPRIPDNQAVAGTVRYVSSDDTSNDHLYNREIQDILRVSLAGRRLDVIGYDACLMAMLETAYAMREIADVMVASEELEPGAGWNYKLVLEKLVKSPSMDGRQLGTALVDAFKEHYGPGGLRPDPTTTLSAVDLSKINYLAGATSELADRLGAYIQTKPDVLRAVRKLSRTYAPGYGLHGIDLGFFVDGLIKESDDEKVTKSAQVVREAVKSTVIANYSGPARKGHFGSNGIAIYFPLTRVLFDYDHDSDGYLESNNIYPLEFVNNYRWDNFLISDYFPRNP